MIPNIYPIALLMLNVQPPKNCYLYDEFNNYINFMDSYLSTNSRYFSQNAIKYSINNESFLEKEYECLFPVRNTKSKNCILNLREKLFSLTQIEFEQIILWSNDFDKNINKNFNYNTKADLGSKRYSFDFDLTSSNLTSWYCSLNQKLNHSNEIFSILSFKIQSK